MPTLIIAAVDDSITPPPSPETATGNVAIAQVAFGGHLGFFQANPYCSSGADRVCCDFAAQLVAAVPPLAGSTRPKSAEAGARG